MNYRTVINNLKELSKIKIGDKLIISNNIIKRDNRYGQGIRRYLDGNQRDNILIPILTTFNSIFLYIEYPRMIDIKTQELKFFTSKVRNIKKILTDALEGLKILTEQTYLNKLSSLNKLLSFLKDQCNKLVLCYSIGDINNCNDYKIFKKEAFSSRKIEKINN